MEELVEVYQNEMLAQLWAEILAQDGIRSLVKPQYGGYGAWGRDVFIPHALYVLPENIDRARAIIKEVDSP